MKREQGSRSPSPSPTSSTIPVTAATLLDFFWRQILCMVTTKVINFSGNSLVLWLPSRCTASVLDSMPLARPSSENSTAWK